MKVIVPAPPHAGFVTVTTKSIPTSTTIEIRLRCPSSPAARVVVVFDDAPVWKVLVMVASETAAAAASIVESFCTLAKNPPLAIRTPPLARMLKLSATVGVKSASSLSADANTPLNEVITTLRPKAEQ